MFPLSSKAGAPSSACLLPQHLTDALFVLKYTWSPTWTIGPNSTSLPAFTFSHAFRRIFLLSSFYKPFQLYGAQNVLLWQDCQALNKWIICGFLAYCLRKAMQSKPLAACFEINLGNTKSPTGESSTSQNHSQDPCFCAETINLHQSNTVYQQAQSKKSRKTFIALLHEKTQVRNRTAFS